MVAPSAAPTGTPIALAGPLTAAPPLGASKPAPPRIGNSEARRAGGRGGAEPLRPGAVPGAPKLDTKGIARVPVPSCPTAPIFKAVTMALAEWQAAVARWLRYFAGELPRGKRRRDWKAKAAALYACGRTVVAWLCGACKSLDEVSGAVVALCGLRVCVVCAHRRSNRLRERLKAALAAGRKHRRMGLYFLTLTLRFNPADPADVSIAGLRRRKDIVLGGWQLVWSRYLRERGFAAARSVEVGEHGMVHVHALYYGRRPDACRFRDMWMFAVGDSPQVKIIPAKSPDKAINELAKYITKGVSPVHASVLQGRLSSFTHPELAARVEVAYFGDRLLQCYGDWRKRIDDSDDNADDEDCDGHDARSATRPACLHCGTCDHWGEQPMDINEWLPHASPQWRPSTTGIRRVQETPSTKVQERNADVEEQV